MITKSILCRVIPRTFSYSLRMVNLKVLGTSKNFFKPSPVNYSPISSVLIPPCYATKAQSTELIVDYDYVKKATSGSDVIIVDVREPDEIKEHGKIPNSTNIPLGNVTTVLSTMRDEEFKKEYNRQKPSEDTEIIFYCRTGQRSGMAQQNALNLGYKNVKNYLGSWTEWATKTP